MGEEKVLPITFEVVAEAVWLEKVAGYFDSPIGSTVKLQGATVISKDTAFAEMGLVIEW